MRRFAISDIHGCLQNFKALLEQIAFSTSDELYILGDYIDRGPDSKGVIDHIWYLQKEGYAVFCLKGNHEDMLLKAQYSASDLTSWLRNGGKPTLESFGVELVREIPSEYRNWFQDLAYYFEVDHYILVHAGLGFYDKNPLKDKNLMLWIRRWYDDINKKWLGNRIILHGHTPTSALSIRDAVDNLHEVPALDIDNGCVYSRAGLGQLLAFDLGTKELHFHKCIDDVLYFVKK